VAKQPAVVIHFWAPWDGHDPLVDRSIQAVAAELADRVCFRSCNVDVPANFPLCKRCQVINIPFLAVFVGGQQRRPIIGALPPVQLEKELAARFNCKAPKQHWWQLWKSPG
jgi:thioredoxin 1